MSNDYEKYVRLAIKGDKEAFGELYSIFLDRIYRFIYYLVGDEFLAEDITQNTFLKAWNSLPKFKLNKGTFQSFLYTIARNLVIDNQRKKKTYSLDGIAESEAIEGGLEEQAWKKDNMHRVHEALDGLEGDDRQIIILRFFEDLEFEEISKIVGKNSGALRVKVHRLMEVLRAKLEGNI